MMGIGSSDVRLSSAHVGRATSCVARALPPLDCSRARLLVGSSARLLVCSSSPNYLLGVRSRRYTATASVRFPTPSFM